MQKKGAFAILILVLMINFASAQFYGTFSIGDLLNSIDDSTLILGIIFVVSFALLQFSLSRVFKDNKAIPAVIALSISLFIIWAVNRSGFDYSLFFYDVLFFIPPGILETFLPLIFTGLAIFLIFKYGFGIMLIVTGILLLGAGFLGLVYEVGTVVVTGLILLVVGIYLAWRRAKKKVLGGMFGSSGGFNVGKYYNQGSQGYANRYEKWAKGQGEQKESWFKRMSQKADEMAENSRKKREENLRAWEERQKEKAREQAEKQKKYEKMMEEEMKRKEEFQREADKKWEEKERRENEEFEREAERKTKEWRRKMKRDFDLRDY